MGSHDQAYGYMQRTVTYVSIEANEPFLWRPTFLHHACKVSEPPVLGKLHPRIGVANLAVSLFGACGEDWKM